MFNCEALEGITDLSQTFTTWTFSALAGSFLAIIGNSHIRPSALKHRLVYLIFIPAWIALALSIWYGTSVQRRIAACGILNDEHIEGSVRASSWDFGIQINSFLVGMGLLALWLGAYLLWWVYNKQMDRPS
jgi:hypothetical protein